MSNRGMSKPSISKQECEDAVKSIVADQTCLFHLVPFRDYRQSHQGRTLTSSAYSKYSILCHQNSMYHAGWVVCPYVLNGYCGSDGMLEMNTQKGGTNRFSRHMAKHEKQDTTGQVTAQELSTRCRRNITDAAALAVILDIRPLSFTDNQAGIAAFATQVFKAGQSVPSGIKINPKSYLPSRGAVVDALTRIGKELRIKYSKTLSDRLKRLGGAVSVDGVSLKIQNRHYYDFTMHHMDVTTPRAPHAKPKFGIKTSTILFIEGPSIASADNIRDILDQNLRTEYGITFDTIQETFTLVTDGAAVMAKMAGSSVSVNIAIPDEGWMRCYVHILHNTMKEVMKACLSDEKLKRIAVDFQTMKKIVTNSKKNGWNSQLPIGYHLIQEVETRFGTHYLVAERFLKSCGKVRALIVSQVKGASKVWFESLLKDPADDTSFPAIEAIIDAFKPVFAATVEFQSSTYPTLQAVLPSLQYCYDELSKIERGELVSRPNNRVVKPSEYSMLLSKVMREELQKITIHDLWLVACFLYPSLRDFQFWKDPTERQEYRLRGETLTRVLYEKEVQNTATDAPVAINVTPTETGTTSNPSSSTFKLSNYVRTDIVATTDRDEVNRYKSTSLQQISTSMQLMGLNLNPDDPFSAVKYWYANRAKYPHLYAIALRVYATPPSSSSSERVFSTLKNIVTSQRSKLSSQNISDLIVSRSLRLYNN